MVVFVCFPNGEQVLGPLHLGFKKHPVVERITKKKKMFKTAKTHLRQSLKLLAEVGQDAITYMCFVVETPMHPNSFLTRTG